jgi:cytochrome oxidase Cu insertion factor (SCO1/SenC/PrrC family)
MGEVKKVFAWVLRRPFVAYLIILAAIVGVSLCFGSLTGVISWGDSTASEPMNDLLSQIVNPRGETEEATASIGSQWIFKRAPDFTLIDQDGRTVSLSGLRGKVILVNFIFTRCEEACPQITRELQGLREHFRSQMGRHLVFLSITLDPEHDTPKALRAYGRKHSLDFTTWSLLTGSREKIDAVQSGFGVYAEKIKTETGHVDILHTAKAYVVDRNGTIVDTLQPGVLSLFGTAVVERVLGASHG